MEFFIFDIKLNKEQKDLKIYKIPNSIPRNIQFVPSKKSLLPEDIFLPKFLMMELLRRNC